MKDIAVVILNWNGRSFLEQFLPAVVEHSADAQIIVADNNSDDDSINFLRNNYPSIGLIQNESNGGFAKGYNDALKQVEAKYYVLLNSDIEVTENWLSPLFEMMQDETVAGCQPKILSFKDKHEFEHAGASGGFLDRNYFPFCRGRIFNLTEHDEGQYNGNTEIFWASGACLMIRSDAYHAADGFDEDFFAHMEEIDLCWRLKRRGYRFMVCPKSKVYHVGGGTLPYTSSRKVYLNFRNSLIMISKNHDGWIFPKIFSRLIIDGVAAIRFIFKGEFKNFGAVFRAHMWHHSHISSVLKKRKALREFDTTFNSKGLYRGNILWDYFFKGIRSFNQLNQRLFK